MALAGQFAGWDGPPCKKQTETGSGDLPEPVGRMVCLKGNFLHHISHLQD